MGDCDSLTKQTKSIGVLLSLLLDYECCWLCWDVLGYAGMRILTTSLIWHVRLTVFHLHAPRQWGGWANCSVRQEGGARALGEAVIDTDQKLWTLHII